VVTAGQPVPDPGGDKPQPTEDQAGPVAAGQPVSDPGGDKPQHTEDEAGPVAAGQPVSDPGEDKPQPTEDQAGPVAAGLLSQDSDCQYSSSECQRCRSLGTNLPEMEITKNKNS
jgi:hypothetical protein